MMMLGFAFSLEADGASGYYNCEIARSIEADYITLHKQGVNPWIGIQWEVYDALKSESIIREATPKEQISCPPEFEPCDIRDVADADLLRLLKWLSSHYSYMKEINRNAEELAAGFNLLLEEEDFSQYFQNLELPTLQRRGHRKIWTEERAVPAYKHLGIMQRRRVNRLIIEGLCPNARGRTIDEIRVYAHPLHMNACFSDIQSITRGRFEVKSLKDCCTQRWSGPLWTQETAQNWCRDQEAWDLYQMDMHLYYTGKEP